MTGKYRKEVQKARAEERRKAVAEYKLSSGCVDCGYDENAYALEFDHLPEFKKTRTVASTMYMSWKAIWEEIAKCEVVCANCHAIRTFTRKNKPS